VCLGKAELPGVLAVFQGWSSRSELLPGDFFVLDLPPGHRTVSVVIDAQKSREAQ